MRTLLSQFCEAFDRSVRPLLEPLKRTTELLAEHPERAYSKAVLPGLVDVTHQFGTLADKVAGQQAYVLIFGPLKSGKSTLMNAMSAAYVSEVTSLPAYPCMVYVSHSEQREFVVTRYDGGEETLHDPAGLRMLVSRAHTELAERIRRSEDAGEEFDPRVHFPSAIRRIDVKVPAGELQESGSVLVDTPGLYSRMKFGYDRMTREFRNAAACAIFVVKTDNLFLEQVFQEFTELLELFSRIFLVVNLDSTKRDLRADGSLEPSLESADPVRIVEAFENLAMSAPLKVAADEGRLRIYPVDLQRAASRRLGGEARAADAAGGFSDDGQADFDGFMTDLTDYLNSTDYLVAFLGDSLRRAGSLLAEVRQACRHRDVRVLADQIVDLERRQVRAHHRLEALGRLAAFDWQEALVGLRDELLEVGRREAGAVAKQSARTLDAALDAWFQKDTSLEALLRDELRPALASAQRELALAVHRALTEHVSKGAEAVRLPRTVAQDMVLADLSFGEFGRGGLDSVDPVARVRQTAPPLAMEEIPVRRSLWDVLLFRSRARVRQRLFGPPSKPALRVPRELKEKRLGDPAREAMRRILSSYREEHFPRVLDGLALEIFGDYAGAVTEALDARVAEAEAAQRVELDRIQEELREYRRVLNRTDELSVAVDRSQGAVDELSHRYRETDPDLLGQELTESVLAVDALGGGDAVVEGERVYELPQPTATPRSAAPGEQEAPAASADELQPAEDEIRLD